MITYTQFPGQNIDSSILNQVDWLEQKCDTAVEANRDIRSQAISLKTYVSDLKLGFVTLIETKSELPNDYFNNYSTFWQHQDTHCGLVSFSLLIEIRRC